MALTAHYAQAIENLPVGFNLLWESVKAVTRALDLETVEPSVDHGYVNATLPTQHPEFMEDAGLRCITLVLRLEPGVQGCSDI